MPAVNIASILSIRSFKTRKVVEHVHATAFAGEALGVALAGRAAAAAEEEGAEVGAGVPSLATWNMRLIASAAAGVPFAPFAEEEAFLLPKGEAGSTLSLARPLLALAAADARATAAEVDAVLDDASLPLPLF